jgi:hypothetical protein
MREMKLKYIKVIFPDKSWFVTDNFDITMLDCLEVGEKAKIGFIELTEEEYKNIPEL